jgi:small-conductance mechanosensitive channel
MFDDPSSLLPGGSRAGWSLSVLMDTWHQSPPAVWLVQALLLLMLWLLARQLKRRVLGRLSTLQPRHVLTIALLRQAGTAIAFTVMLLMVVAGTRVAGWAHLALLLDHVTATAVALCATRVAGWALRTAMRPHDLLRFLLWMLEWAILIGLSLSLLGLLRPVMDGVATVHFAIGGQVFKGRNIVVGVLLAVLAFTLAAQALRLIEWVLSRYALRHQMAANDALLLRRVLAHAIFFFTALGVLVSSGIEATTLAAFLGALGLGIGIGIQETVGSIVNGMYMLAENTVKVGDHITINNVRGRVTQLTSRAIVMRNAEGTECLVPNSMITRGMLQNHTLSNDEFKVSFPWALADAAHVEVARGLIHEILSAHPRTLPDRPMLALVTSVRAGEVMLEVSCWINDLHNGTGVLISDLNLSIAMALRSHGIAYAEAQSRC